jgi:hypothetical protein
VRSPLDGYGPGLGPREATPPREAAPPDTERHARTSGAPQPCSCTQIATHQLHAARAASGRVGCALPTLLKRLVSLLVTCAQCREAVLEADRIGDKEECAQRDHPMAVNLNALRCRPPSRSRSRVS